MVLRSIPRVGTRSGIMLLICWWNGHGRAHSEIILNKRGFQLFTLIKRETIYRKKGDIFTFINFTGLYFKSSRNVHIVLGVCLFKQEASPERLCKNHLIRHSRRWHFVFPLKSMANLQLISMGAWLDIKGYSRDKLCMCVGMCMCIC